MSIILKEKNYDQLIRILKIFLLLMIFIFIFLTALNYYFNFKISNIQESLNILKGEELKYKELIKNSEQKLGKKANSLLNYDFILELSNLADQLYFNSIQLREEKLLLDANTKIHQQIFKLTEDLKKIDYINTASLLKITKDLKNYNFQVECFIGANY